MVLMYCNKKKFHALITNARRAEKEDATRTKIINKSLLSYKQLKEYLALLVENDLIEQTYLDKSRVPDRRCLVCDNISISTFPILPNEEFTLNYNEKRGVELAAGGHNIAGSGH